MDDQDKPTTAKADADQGADNGESRRLLRIRDVMAKTALPRSSLHEKIAAGKFPKPVKLGARAVAWWDHEVDAWLDSRPRVGSVDLR